MPIVLALLALHITGAAFDGHTLLSWGNRIVAWPLPSLKPHTLARTATPTGLGGCLDDTGHGLFLQEGDRLVYRQAPTWKPCVLDHGIDMHDCLAATLLGHRGVLVVQRGMQLRFYEYPDFRYTEIYSFYSASRQGGLLITDIDNDGLPDIVCGNYWIKSPASFDLTWHDFAIELYNDLPEAATLRLAFDHGDLLVAQGELPSGRLARFRKPENPRVLWDEVSVELLHFPRALAVAPTGWIAGEDHGPGSRLLRSGEPVLETRGLVAAFAYNGRFLVVSHSRVHLWP